MINNSKDESVVSRESQFKDLWGEACKLLGRREYSLFELATRLEGSGSREAIESVLAELVKQGLQSDLRFAEMVGRTRVSRGKGPVKLRYELGQHRIESELIKQILAQYDDQWTELAKRARTQKYGSEPPATYREWAKQARFLQQRGFTVDQIGKFSGD